ncbi:MAG: hypothetical protein ACKPBG_09445, partial [Actinomycetota bacterium]
MTEIGSKNLRSENRFLILLAAAPFIRGRQDSDNTRKETLNLTEQSSESQTPWSVFRQDEQSVPSGEISEQIAARNGSLRMVMSDHGSRCEHVAPT